VNASLESQHLLDLGRGWKEWKLSIPVFLRFFFAVDFHFGSALGRADNT